MTKEEKDILAVLREDARLSVSEIAVQLKLSEKVVSKAILNLEKDGVILGYHAVVDDEKSKVPPIFLDLPKVIPFPSSIFFLTLFSTS